MAGLPARQAAADNVEQTLDTSRDKVMTFSYDMSLEPKYDKPTYPGTGNGLGGEEGEYDVSQEEENEFRTLVWSFSTYYFPQIGKHKCAALL